MRYLLLLAAAALVACGSGAVAPSPTPSAVPSASSAPASPSPSTAPSGQIDACHQGGAVYCVLNPDVTQATISRTICVSGWTRTVRPPVSYTSALKRQQLQQLTWKHPGDPNWTLSGTEEDHRMPLELGGAPRDVMNLSPEEPPSPNPKDRDESSFRELVCNGQLTLAEAQQQFVRTWLGIYPDYRK